MSNSLKTLAVLALAVVCLVACKDDDHYPGERTADGRRTVLATNDSVMSKSPRALSIIRERISQASDSLAWYDYHLIDGRRFLLTDSPDSALPYVERTLRFLDRQPSTPRTRGLRSSAYNTKAGYLYMFHQMPDSAIRLYREAYDLMMDGDMKELLPSICANLADAYVSVSDLPNGSRWYRRALYLNDSLTLPEQNTLSLYMGLGRIYTTLHDFDQARHYYELTDRRFGELKPNMQSYFLNNYGNLYYYSKDYEKALRMFRRLKAHIIRYDGERNFDMYLCKINLADVFLNLGQTDSARIYLEEPERYFREKGVDVGIYYAQTIRMGIALREGQYGEVERIIRESEGADVADIDMRSIRKDYLNRYYAAIGDYRRAYNALASSIALTDSAEYGRQHMRSSEVMTRLTEDTIRLHHQLELNQRQMRYEKTRNLSVLTIGLLIIFFLLSVIYSSQQRKRYLLTRLDMLTQRLLNARQRVSPHFIFNVLNSRIARAGQPEGEQLGMLAHLIRTNLELTQKTLVTLDEELDFVRQYIDLGRMTYGLDFDFSIDVTGDESTHQVRMPSMMIQILTENAILHGLRNKEGDKRLRILVEDLGQTVRVSVIDNGPGFDIRTYNSEQARTGLNIIRTTISTVNQENKKSKMSFELLNDHGCHAILTLSKDIKYPTS